MGYLGYILSVVIVLILSMVDVLDTAEWHEPLTGTDGLVYAILITSFVAIEIRFVARWIVKQSRLGEK